MRWTQRLPVRAAFVTSVAGLLCATAAVGIIFALSGTRTAPPREWLFALGACVVVSAGGAAWWANRQARTLRGAVEAASTALTGHSRSSAVHSANESTGVAHAVNALVQRAERSSRELSQRQAYAAVGDFAAELARELAPSVQSARSSMRTLETNLHIDSPLRPPLARAQRELHKLANTLQDTLRLARSGRLASNRLDLWLPLRSAIKIVSADASARGIWIEPPPHGRAPIWIHGDHEALEQLFLNLLINGVQATESGGRVDVQVHLADDATVAITDSGCGIPEGALDRVFEPFYSTKAERAGLGLAIAWRTAAAHGGRLSIESALGRGTAVQVALPLADSGSAYLLE